MKEACASLVGAAANVVNMLRPTYLVGLFAVYKLAELFISRDVVDKDVLLVLIGVVLGGIIASNGKLLDGPDPMATVAGKLIDKLS